MSEKFKNKYCADSARLSGYDYGQNGMYFVTICAKDRENFFGEVDDGKMVLNGVGEIVREEWLQTSIIRPNVFLDEWVVMPNHIHGIIEIFNALTTRRDGLQSVSTQGMDDDKIQQYKNKFGPQKNNLASIIRGFKGMVTKRVHMCGYDNFAWQSRFHDRIIRNDRELNRIREYIQNNPAEWERDRNLSVGEENDLKNLWM